MNKSLQKSYKLRTALVLVLSPVITILVLYLAAYLLGEERPGYLVLAIALLISLLFSFLMSKIVTDPLIATHRYLARFVGQDGSANEPSTKLTYAQPLVDEIISNFTACIEQLQNVSDDSFDQRRNIMTVLDNIPHPILGLNEEVRILYANATAQSLLSSDDEPLEGVLLHERLNLQDQNQQLIEPWIQESRQTVATNENRWHEISYSNPSSRRTYSFDVYAQFRRNQNPQAVETTVMMLDRTLEREHDNLKVDFVAMAAHELRAPITVIRGYIEVLQDELHDSLNREQVEFMRRLEVSAAQLSGFINNILSVARIDRGEMRIRLERREWGTILTQALQELSLRASTYGKVLRADIPEELPEVMVDPISIVEVVNNLVDNAIKYSKDSQDIVVRCRIREDGMIETIVQDFGVGIPSNLVDKLFTKFYRSHRTKTSFGGSGLGLYISRAIIKAHRGDVWVQSKEGQGSSFGFLLPPADKLAGEPQARNNEEAHGYIKNHSKYRR